MKVIKFEHPVSRKTCVGRLIREDENDRPTGNNITIVEYDGAIISVPNGLVKHKIKDGDKPEEL